MKAVGSLLLLLLGALAIVTWACDDSSPDAGDVERCSELDAENPALEGVAESFCRSSFTATYDWNISSSAVIDDSGGFPLPERVIVSKLGVSRLKIDVVTTGDDGSNGRLVVLAEHLDEEGSEAYVVCSFSGGLPSIDDDICYRETDSEGFGPIFMYGIFSWLYGGGGFGEITQGETRTVAGESGDCYLNTAVDEVEAEFCYNDAGVALYARRGEDLIQLTDVTYDVEEDDFAPPLAVSDVPTPDSEFPSPTPFPPDEAIDVRLRMPSGTSSSEADETLKVLRDRLQRVVDPTCLSRDEVVSPEDPAARFSRECVSIEEGVAVLRFEISGYDDRWADAELAEWLTATGDPDAVRVRLCEPMLDDEGNVATAGVGDVTYAPGTCDADIGGASVSYVDRLDADPDTVIWTPATGDLNGERVAFTDEYLLSAYFDHPPGPTNHRFFYVPSPEGEQILNSIWARLGPTSERRIRTNDDYYSLAVFIDGAPMRDLDGEIALQDIYRTEWAPQGILNLSPDEARRVTQLIVGPDLQIQLGVLSITRSPAPADD